MTTVAFMKLDNVAAVKAVREIWSCGHVPREILENLLLRLSETPRPEIPRSDSIQSGLTKLDITVNGIKITVQLF